jgi:hypothetical protein
MGRKYIQIGPTTNYTELTTLQLQPITLGNNNWQEEQQTIEPMDFISFVSWAQLKLLLVFDNIYPMIMDYSDDTVELGLCLCSMLPGKIDNQTEVTRGQIQWW